VPAPPTAAPSGLRVLVVQHEAGAPAAWLGEALEQLGVELVVARPYDGQRLPGLDGYDGLVVLGGAVDSWDDEAAPWLPGTRELVRVAETTGVPVLGICLGHQIAVSALGGEVGRNPAESTVAVVALGWLPEATEDPMLRTITGAQHAVHWNNDVAQRLPDGAVVLARSPDGAVQAARLGQHVWGVQFHPEAGPSVLEQWDEEDGHDLRARGIDLDALIADARRYETELHAECRRLGEAFAGLVARTRAGAGR
jgi:GMP synthase (glutamine-hydrolysing)